MENFSSTTRAALRALYLTFGLYLGYVVHSGLVFPWWLTALLCGCVLLCHPAAIATLFFGTVALMVMEDPRGWFPAPPLSPDRFLIWGLPVLVFATVFYSAWRQRWTWFPWSRPGRFVRAIHVLLPYGLALLLAKFLYRDVDLERVASGIGLCLALRMQTAGSLGADAPRVRSEYGHGALVLGSLSVGLVFAELLLRTVLPGPAAPSGLYRVHPDYVFTLNSDVSTTYRFNVDGETTREVTWQTSSQGLRDRLYDPKEAGETRILLLGDSFTMGHTVELEDTIGRQLETMLASGGSDGELQVINGGMSGAGAWQEWGILRDKGLALKPDLVILQVFMSNDIDNALEVVDKRTRAFNTMWFDMYFAMRESATPQMEIHRWLRQHCALYRLVGKSLDMAVPIHPLLNDLWFLPPLPEPGPPNQMRIPHMEDRLEPWYPELDEGFAIMCDYIARMRDLCAEQGIPFAAYALPDNLDIYDSVWEENVHNPMSRDFHYVRGKSVARIERFFEEAGIPYFRVGEAIGNAGGPDDTYYALDGHLTPLGNRAVAEAMAAFIVERYGGIVSGTN